LVLHRPAGCSEKLTRANDTEMTTTHYKRLAWPGFAAKAALVALVCV